MDARVRLEDVPAGARVELSYRDDEVIEGTVAGAEVRLTGRVGSRRGPLKGTWGGAAVAPRRQFASTRGTFAGDHHRPFR